jgi:hypothetical protein
VATDQGVLRIDDGGAGVRLANTLR